MNGTLQFGNDSPAELRLQGIAAHGVLQPVLTLRFSLAVHPDFVVTLDTLRLDVKYETELLGTGLFIGIGEHLRTDHQVWFDVPASSGVLRQVAKRLQPKESHVALEATLRGTYHYCRERNAAQPSEFVTTLSEAKVDEWNRGYISGSQTRLEIHRSEWYSRVESQVNSEDFHYFEVALPAYDQGLAKEWNAAIEKLRQAERSYASGDDSGVFVTLRGAIDALPGAKKEVLKSVTDINKRKATDEMLLAIKNFLNQGCHVSEQGSENPGHFPVDHLDAGFAIDVTKIVLSHLSIMLGAEKRRAQAQER